MDYESLGMRIRRARKAAGMTQADLAEKLGISTSFLGHIERGTRKASLETVVGIANALNVSTDLLLQDSLDIMTRPLSANVDLSEYSRALLTDIAGVLREHDVVRR